MHCRAPRAALLRLAASPCDLPGRMPLAAPAPLRRSGESGTTHDVGPAPLARPFRKPFGRRLSRAAAGQATAAPGPLREHTARMPSRRRQADHRRPKTLPSPAGRTAAAETIGQAAGPRPFRALPARRPSRTPVGQSAATRPAIRPHRGLPGHRSIPCRAGRPSGERPAPETITDAAEGSRPARAIRGPRHGDRRTDLDLRSSPVSADENAGRAEVRWMAARLPPLKPGFQFRPPCARPDGRRVFDAVRKGLANAEDDGGGITPRRRSARIEFRSFRNERKLSTLSFRIERRSLRRLLTFTN